MNCPNCNCGLSSFSMCFNSKTNELTPKYGSFCSFSCTCLYQEKLYAQYPSEFEKITHGNLTYYVMKTPKYEVKE